MATATVDLSAGLVPRASKGKEPVGKDPAAASTPIDITSGLIQNQPDESSADSSAAVDDQQQRGLWDRVRSKVQSITEPTVKHKGEMPNPAYGILGPPGMILDPITREIGTNFIKRTGRALFGLVDFAPQAYSALKDALSSDPKVSEDGEARLLALHPGAQIADRVKELKEDYKKDPKLAATNVAGDVAAMWLADKVTAGAPEAVKKGLSKSVEAAEKTAKTMTGVHKATATKVIDKTLEENRAAGEKATEANAKQASEHQEKVQSALHETKGRELEHQVKVKSAQEKALDEHRQAVTEAKEHNQRVHDKAEATHQEAITRVKEHNDRVAAKHEAIATRVKEENAAAEHALELRRQKEADLEKQTKEYYAKEDEVKAKAKAEENAAWQPWHDKMEGVEIDGGRIAKPLQEIASRSPDLARMIHQLVPDPADAAPESQYALDRSAIMKSQGMDPEKTNYWDLPADKRVTIDKIAASSGFEPEPIDFDPQAGKAIPVEAVHRAKSILGRYAASGRYEGMVLGEMKQVLKVLDQAETRASLDHGALGDLEAARKATQRYQQAFGRERHIPRTQDDIREKEANPEAYKEREDQERLEAARKHSPELVEAHEKVKDLREEIRGMKTEEQLRKSIKRVPPPPSVGDLRGGYRLKSQPKYVPPSVGDLREGYRLKPEPTLDLSLDRRQNAGERKRIAEMNPEEMRQALLTSDKTGLPNKRAFDEAQRDHPSAIVGISDADGLKAFNDKYGYAAGDALLKAKADALKAAGLDAYHDKGDEFLYRGASIEDMGAKLEKAREILRNMPIGIKTSDGKTLKFNGVDFSYGVAEDLAGAQEKMHANKAERKAGGAPARAEFGRIAEVEGSKAHEPSKQPAPAGPRPEFTPSSIVESPHRAEFPDRPTEVKPEIKQVGPEDIQKANEEIYLKNIDRLRNYGIWIVGGVLFETVRSLAKLHFGEAISDLIGGAGAVTLSRVGLNKVADLLESPKARDFIARPSKEQIAELEKLPPEQRKVVASGLKKVNVVARKKGYKVSGAIAAYIAANKSIRDPADETMVTPHPKGLKEPGNLPIWTRPIVENDDGSHSSEYSTSFEDPKTGYEVLVPTVVDGKFLTPDGKKPEEGSEEEKAMFKKAWQHYLDTGENLGKFDNADDADGYSEILHNRGEQ